MTSVPSKKTTLLLVQFPSHALRQSHQGRNMNETNIQLKWQLILLTKITKSVRSVEYILHSMEINMTGNVIMTIYRNDRKTSATNATIGVTAFLRALYNEFARCPYGCRPRPPCDSTANRRLAVESHGRRESNQIIQMP